MGYDGYFQLDFFADILTFVKPNQCGLDIEGYSSPESYVDEFSNSENMKSRQKDGESPDDTVRRIAEEMNADIEECHHRGSPNTKLIFYGLRPNSNVSYVYADYSVFEKYGIRSQPSLYHEEKDPQVLATLIRQYKKAIGNVEMFPIVSPGTYGYYSSDIYLENCIQMFANGATSMHIYGSYLIADHLYYIHLQKCYSMITEHEDIIVDGEIGFYDIKASKNLVIGSMKKDGSYMIGVSLKNSHKSENRQEGGTIKVDIGHSQVEITDLNDHSTLTFRNVNGTIEFDLKNTQIPTVVYIKNLNQEGGNGIFDLFANFGLLEIIIGTIVAALALIVLLFLIGFVALLVFCIIKKKKDKEDYEMTNF